MSEKCQLPLVQAETNQELIEGPEIPSACRECLRIVLNKSYLRSQLEWMGEGVVSSNLDRMPDNYGILAERGKLRRLIVSPTPTWRRQEAEIVGFLCKLDAARRPLDRIVPVEDYL